MFDFEKLEVYRKAKAFNREIFSNILQIKYLDRALKDQLRRASLSIILNIAEGSGRFSNADRRNFYVIARGSVYECVAIADILKDEGFILPNEFQKYYLKMEELSKMLFAMINKLQ